MEETLINGKTLSFYLRHPGALKAVDRSDLIGLATQFPYSAHLHLLLTVKDHLENKSADRQLLERAALYISDRRKLGEWMNKLQSLRQEEGLVYGTEHLEVLSQSLEDLAAGTEKDQLTEQDPPVLENLDFEAAPEAQKYDESDFPEEDVWVEKIEVQVDDGLVEKIVVQVDEELVTDEPSGSIIEKNVEEVNADLLKEDTQFAQPDVEDAKEEGVEEESLPSETVAEELVDLPDAEPALLQSPVDEQDVALEQAPEETPSIREEKKREVPELKSEETGDPETPFLRWLQRLETGKMGGFVDLEADRSHRSIESEEKSNHKSSKKKKKKKKKKKSWKQDSLRIDETLVSEALADLLATQGHTERAIEMYEKLRLTIPEKSVFFAQKIKALMPKN